MIMFHRIVGKWMDIDKQIVCYTRRWGGGKGDDDREDVKGFWGRGREGD